MNNKVKEYIKYSLASILPVCVCVGLSLLFTDTKQLWYIDLTKPVFHPDDNVLIIGWLTAMVGMVAALILAYSRGGVKGRALYISGLCLSLIALWHYIFNMGNVVTGFYAMSLTTLCGIYTLICLFKRHKAAGVCAMPLVLWLGYLCAVNYMIFMMN